LAQGRPHPLADILCSQALSFTPKSRPQGATMALRAAGKQGACVLNTLEHPLALVMTPRDVGGRERVGKPAREVQRVTGKGVEPVVRLPEAWRGVGLPSSCLPD